MIPEVPSPPKGAPLAPEGPQSNQGLVRAMIALVVLVIMGAMALLYWNWLHSRFPSSTLLFIPQPGESTEGIEIQVMRQSEPERPIVTATFGPKRSDGRPAGQPVPILVEGGDYRIVIRNRDEVIRDWKAYIPDRRSAYIPVTTRPSTP